VPQEGDTDGGTPPAPQEPLLSGSFAGSSSVSGQNLLWALVYRAPGASGHDHVVRSPDFSGSMTYRVGALSDCSVSVTVPVPTLINDETEMRARVGLADVTNDFSWNVGGGQAAVKNNMLAANQLNAAGFPTISFQSTACRGTAVASGTLLVDGQLTLRGQTKPVTWALDLQVTGRTIRAKGTLRIRQTEYGITPYSFLGFTNDDPVDLEFDIVVNG
jgi:polyisoprenoid-binding protein YceI